VDQQQRRVAMPNCDAAKGLTKITATVAHARAAQVLPISSPFACASSSPRSRACRDTPADWAFAEMIGLNEKGPGTFRGPLLPLAYIRPNNRYPYHACTSWKAYDLRGLNEGGLGPIVAGWI
jgi:hypothetical protein